MNITKLDLNLLKVFDALHAERQVSRAAKRVFLSQPAFSHALARLRESLQDDLFTRTRFGMQPTPYAETLALQVRDALAQIDAALGAQVFEPATSQRMFTIGATDYIQFVLAPRLLARLERVAPQVRLTVRGFGDRLPVESLARGDLDLAIGFFASPSEGVFMEKLFDERFVCMARRDHPRFRKGCSLNDYLAARHLLISPQGGGFVGVVDQVLAKRKLKRNVVCSIQQFLVTPFAAAESDTVVTVAERVARNFAQVLPLRVFEPPFAVPGFEVGQVWHSRTANDKGLNWLRDEIRTLEKGQLKRSRQAASTF